MVVDEAEPMLLAADIGGTSSRVLVCSAREAAAGQPLHPVRGPGCNLRSSGTEAFGALTETVREALGDVPGEDVSTAVLAVAGAGPARAREVAGAAAGALAPLGIDQRRLTITDDQLVAFLAGGAGDDGILLLAGTGAVTVLYRGRRAEVRRDGMGWLLGDIGSAVWLGRRTVQAVAADIDQRGRRTALTEKAGELLGLDLREGRSPRSPTGDVRQDLIRALDDIAPASAPAGLGRFAPLPAAVPGDPAARDILDTATRHFTDTVRALDPQLTLPVVLAGSVLTSPGPIQDEVITGLEADGRAHRIASSGLPGALLLAQEAAAAGTSTDELR